MISKKNILRSTTFLASTIVFAALPSVAAADPVTIAISAVTAGASTFIAKAGFAYFAKSFLVNVGLAYLSQSLTPKPRQGTQFTGDLGYQVSGVSAAADHAIIYGQTRVGGPVVYKEVTDAGKYLHQVIALAGHECEEIGDIYINDEVLTLDGDGIATAPTKYSGYIRVLKHLGADDQVADATLIDESDGKWTSDHRLRGIAYIYVRLEFNADSFPNGEPNISAIVKGKKVYDPNTATTAWSANAALCLRDYLTSDYGLATSDIDDTTFASAANVCDESVALAAGGSEARYTINGTFTTALQPKEVIDNLLRSMGGTLWYAQGVWKCKAAAYTSPVASFNEDDLRSSIRINTRHSRRDNFNTVKGTFRGPETNYQVSDYPQVTSSTFVDVDGGEESTVDFDLGYTSTASTAQRLAKIALYRNREQLTVSASFGMKAFQVTVGDIIQLTNSRAGWTDKTFEVVGWTFRPSSDQALLVDMDLREISSAVFDWSAEEAAFETNNTTLADPFDVPGIGLAVSSEARVINEHLTNVIIVTITSDSPERIDQVEVQFKKSGSSDYSSAGFGDLGVFEILDVEDDNYDIRARAINTFGIKGDFTFRLGFPVVGLAAPPSDVTNFSFNVSSAGIHLEWDAVADLDLSFYRIRHATAETSATFANATTAVDKVARPGNSVTVPPRSGTYMIKAYDKAGNQSVNATSVVVRAEDLDVFATTSTQTEHTAFSGSKTGCSVDGSNRLRITDPSSAPSTATYDFSNYIDTGSVRVARVNMEMKVVRVNDAADTFDTLTGLFDSLPGNFDDLTGASSFADCNVIQFVSTTDDDPAGTPTWSAYKRFKAGDFSGRAFRFRIQLESTSDDVTPALEELAAKVRYN